MDLWVGGIVFYSNRKENKVEECKITKNFLQFPIKVSLESLDTKETFTAYPDWECFDTMIDAQDGLLLQPEKRIY